MVGASRWVTPEVCVTHGTNASAARPAGLPTQAGASSGLPVRAPSEVAVNLKKVLTWLLVAFVVWYVIQNPEGSAEIVRNAGTALGDAATSLSEFVGSLA